MKFATKLKLFLTLGVVAIVGAATPAMARPPRDHHHNRGTVAVHVGTPTFRIGLDFGRRHDSYRHDNYQFRRGVALENEGQQLVAQGRDLEWRGHRWGSWHQVRKGERLQRRGYALIREGQELQARARW